jgi:D-aspartate ligase
VGIAHPWTRPVATRREAAEYRGPFPVLLKPATKPYLKRPAVKAWRVEDAAALLRHFDEAAAQTEPGSLVLQELIPGHRHVQYSYAALCDTGRVLASVTAERVRQHPPDLGRSSTYVETVTNAEVEAAGRRILAELQLTGLAEVEFKRDPRDGSYRLLDINLRVWGWHTIARRAGLDFPYLAWRLAVGEPVAEVRAPAGLRWLRLTTDLAAGAHEIAAGDLGIASYLRSLVRPHERPIAAADDPVPGLAEVPLFLTEAVRERFGRRRGPALGERTPGAGPRSRTR